MKIENFNGKRIKSIMKMCDSTLIEIWFTDDSYIKIESDTCSGQHYMKMSGKVFEEIEFKDQ